MVYVETPDLLRLPDAERNRRIAVLRLAESLDAEAITPGGPSAAGEILGYARTRNVTRILVGSSLRARWRQWLRPSTTELLIKAKRDFEVSVIGSVRENGRVEGEKAAIAETAINADEGADWKRWRRYALALAGVAAATAVCFLLYPLLELANLVMIYLLATALVAVRGGRRAAVLCAVLSVLAFDFMFVPPRFTFAVRDAQYLVTFAIMLVVALIIGGLNANVRLQERIAGHRERRTALLYAMTRQLVASNSRDDMARIAVQHVSEVFASRAVLLFADAAGHAIHPECEPEALSYRGAALGIAQWVLDHGKPAGLGTDTLAGAAGLYMPVPGAQHTHAVLALLPSNRSRCRSSFGSWRRSRRKSVWHFERAALAGQAQAAQVRAQTEAIRNSLLASISHDLRTPLATIVGGASALAADQLSASDRRALAGTVAEEAAHVSERITTLLDLVRLESGAIRPRLDWYAIDEVVDSALHRMADRLQRHTLRVERPESLPPPHIDGRLIEQVLENLLDNAAKYTPPSTEVVLRVGLLRRHVELSVEDNGPGLGVDDPIREIPARSARRQCRRHWRGAVDLPYHHRPARRQDLGGESEPSWLGLPLHPTAVQRGRTDGRRRVGHPNDVSHASRVVLIIEDEPPLRRVLRVLLEAEQFRVIEAGTAELGILEAQSHKPDLVILDLGLPDRDGMEVIHSVRTWSQIPIIVLSARVEEANKVAALQAGADDYVTKPFAAGEFSARIRVALRHVAHIRSDDNRVTIGKWQIDLHARTVLADDGGSIHLTPIEFRLLEILAQHLGFVVTHQQILRQVWGPGSDAQTHYLRTYMKQLRQKLEPDAAKPSWLLTDTGVGYRLIQHS